MNVFKIEACSSGGDYESALGVTRAYTDWLGVDLDFQNIDSELENFSQVYGAPEGFYLLARSDQAIAGGVGLRGLDAAQGIAEMKRLFVYDGFKGLGLGELLCKSLLERARNLGYTRVRLDTLPVMGAAHSLYRKLGFHEIDPYCHNPVVGARFLECKLDRN